MRAKMCNYKPIWDVGGKRILRKNFNQDTKERLLGQNILIPPSLHTHIIT